MEPQTVLRIKLARGESVMSLNDKQRLKGGKNKTFDEVLELLWQIEEECGMKNQAAFVVFDKTIKDVIRKRCVINPIEKFPEQKQWEELQKEILKRLKPRLLEYWQAELSAKDISIEFEFSNEIITKDDISAMKCSKDPLKTLSIRQLMRRQ